MGRRDCRNAPPRWTHFDQTQLLRVADFSSFTGYDGRFDTIVDSTLFTH
jgi:hypothetical protein